MSRVILVWLAALLVALAPDSLPAQQARGMLQHSPVDRLIEQREAFALSAEQVARLQVIDRRMEEVNRPLVQRLLELRGGDPVRPEEMTPEQREAFRARVEQARPLMQQIRRNNHEAMREVGTVLNDEQKAKVREHLRQRREQRRGAEGQRLGRRGPRGGG
jgi:hypothetical protein